MRFRTIHLVCIAVTAISGVLGAAPAMASSGQFSIFQSDRETVQQGPGVSASTLDEIAALGADVVKAQVLWRDVAPATRPADPSSPGSYNWANFDTFVRNVRRRGMRPYMGLGGRAPDWATRRSCRGARPGTCRPSNTLFRQFALAAGRHFTGGELHVDLWSLWNEPNLAFWLTPQRSRRGAPLSPSIYRRLYASGRRGLSQAGHGGDTILLGELAPLGSRRRGVSQGIMPLAFIREMACVNSRFRRLSRRRRRARRCSNARIRTSGLAIHPYTARFTRSRGRRRDAATVHDLGRLRRTADRSRRRLRTRRLGIFITELGFQSNPPDNVFGVSLRTVARRIDETEHIAYRSPRIKSVAQYTLFDDPGGDARRLGGFQQGLRFALPGGGRKPQVYDAYRMPFFVKVKRRRARGRVELFGGVRAKRLANSFVTIESALPGQPFTPVFGQQGAVRLNARGYFRRVVRLSRATRRTYRLRSTETGQVRTKRAVRR